LRRVDEKQPAFFEQRELYEVHESRQVLHQRFAPIDAQGLIKNRENVLRLAVQHEKADSKIADLAFVGLVVALVAKVNFGGDSDKIH